MEPLRNSEYSRFAQQILGFYVPLAIKLPALRKDSSFMEAHVKAVGQTGIADIVTGADKYMQQQIKDAAGAVHPEWQFWGEEGEDNVSKYDPAKSFLLITDPIEGTNNFRAEIDDQWGSVIALVDSKIQEPVIGIVAHPTKRLFYVGVKGEGAYKLLYDEGGELLSSTSMQSEPEPGYQQFTYNASPHFSPELIHVVDNFLAMGQVEPDKEGATDLEKSRKAVQVADVTGRTHTFVDTESGALEAVRNRGTIYFKTSNEMAAVFVILGELGGKVTDADGKPWALGINTLISARTVDDYNYLKSLIDTVRK